VAYSKRFDDALLYAVDVHRDQVRKGSSIPYVTHLLGVASIVGESGGSEDEVIAALLHDAIEDTDATYTTLADRFDKPVADIVRACSDTDVTPKPAWEKRKKDYIAHVVGASESVRLVSAADKLANARSVLADLRVLGDELWSSGGLLLMDIEVDPLPRKHSLKQCSQLFWRVLVGERPPVSQKHYVRLQPCPYPPQRSRP
jgi:GTP pyrophosphokinase